jgi:hypothetical protein
MTREEVVEKVKLLGQEVIDRADDLVGDIDWMYGLKIILEVDVYGRPTIEARRYMHPRLRKEKRNDTV